MSESESFCLLLSHGDSASDDVGVLKMSRGCGVLIQLTSLKDDEDS